MVGIKKVLFTIFVTLIPAIAITLSVYLIRKGKEEVKGVSESVIEECTPYIVNMIPIVGHPGEEYFFFPRVVGCDIDEVEIEIGGVNWLGVTQEKYIYGVPQVSDIGTHKIEIVVRSLTGSSKLTDYIIVQENEE